MSISSSMNAGISGLSANSNKLAAISDNIANSQTAGYKRADIDFAAVAMAGSDRLYTAGGVRTTAIRDVEGKGAFVGTANATDLAVAGRGMIPVTSAAAAADGGTNLPLMLVPTGSFQPDANGVLRTASGLVLMGWPADRNGTVPEPPRDTAAALRPIVIDRAAVASAPTTTINLNANLPAAATQPGSDTTAEFPLTLEYFDNLGGSQSMGLSFKPAVEGTPPDVVPNTWVLTIKDNADNAKVRGIYTIEFSDDAASPGRILNVDQSAVPVDDANMPLSDYNGETGEITMTLAGNQQLTVRLGASGGLEPQYLGQLASAFSPVGVTKDGSPAGTFSGVSINENGYLSVNYSSGFSKVVYKVPVADVPNLNGLRATDNQAFVATRESGNVYFWDAGTGPVGTMMGFALEQSATDVAKELTQLIQTQRAYSSNAKIIQTSDEMLQETTNLKR